eukprot:9518673-Alexandrium_andersonii.AAC.1
MQHPYSHLRDWRPELDSPRAATGASTSSSEVPQPPPEVLAQRTLCRLCLSRAQCTRDQLCDA